MQDISNAGGVSVDPKVLIGIPLNYKFIESPFFISYAGMAKTFPPGYEVFVAVDKSIAAMRNLMATRAIDGDFTHLFMLDVDMVYPDQILPVFLSYDVDIIQGLCCGRSNTDYMPIYARPKPGHRFVQEFCYPKGTTGIVESSMCGGGGTLIKVDVLRALSYPYFMTLEEDGEVIGEDLYLSVKAREAGFKCWTCLDMPIDHLVSSGAAIRPNADGSWTRETITYGF